MKKQRSQSQRIRDLILRIYEKKKSYGENIDISFDEYYEYYTEILIEKLQEKLDKILPPL